MYYLITFKINTEAFNQFISVFFYHLMVIRCESFWLHHKSDATSTSPHIWNVSKEHQYPWSQTEPSSCKHCIQKERKKTFISLKSHDITSFQGVGTVAFNQNSLLMTSFLGRSSSLIPHEQYQDDFIHEESAFQTNRISICFLLSFAFLAKNQFGLIDS